MPQVLDWPLDQLPVIVSAGRYPLDQRRHETVYRHPTVAVHLHEVAGVLRRDGRDEAVAEGDLVVSFPHGATSYAQQGAQRMWCIHFQPAAPSAAVTAAIPASLPLGPHRAAVAEHMATVASFHAGGQGDPLARARASAAMLEFLLNLAHIAQQQGTRGRGRSDAAATTAAEWIAAHCTETMVVPRLARQVGLSQHALSRRFRVLFGDTMQGYQIRCRIAQARMMLAHSTTPLRLLARHLGFTDLQHFSRHFRRLTGLPPGAYREHHRVR